MKLRLALINGLVMLTLSMVPILFLSAHRVGAQEAQVDKSVARGVALSRSVALSPDGLDVAASLSVTPNLPATQGDFVVVPVVFNPVGNSVTSLAFELHYDMTKLMLNLGPNSGGTKEVLSVGFTGLPAAYVAGAFVNTGAETDVEVFVHLDPALAGSPPNPLPLIPSGVLVNLTFQAIGVGPVTTPLTFELTSPAPSAGLSDGSSLAAGVTSSNGSVLISPAVQTLNFVPGLNLIGLTVVPTTSTPSSVFAPLGTNLNTVFEYANCSGYRSYVRTFPDFLNDLTTIDVKHGYWVLVNVTATLQITGSIPTFPVSIPLCAGLNLISYPSKVNIALPGAMNASIPGQWTFVFGEPFPYKSWIAAFPPFLNDLPNMGPGRGYWVNTTTATTLTVNAGP